MAGVFRDHGHRYEDSAQCNDGAVYQTIVGMYRPNSMGLCDMLGNVRELMQSCHRHAEDDSAACLEYDVAGESWHWKARGVGTPDSIMADFQGSIEGFGLVLDSAETAPLSRQTQFFQKNLSDAQQQARKQHASLKALPAAPEFVTVQYVSNDEARISWRAVDKPGITYRVYRSYLDPKGKHSREWEQVAEKVKGSFILDNLPGSGMVKYRVYSNNTHGDSPASSLVQLGTPPIFSVNQKIEAEHFANERFTRIHDKDDVSAAGFSANARHYATGQTPFLPAWLKFPFSYKTGKKGTIEARVRGQANAIFEIWQGHHLVGRFTLPEHEGFINVSQKTALIASEDALEVRAANQKWFMPDWFTLKL